MTSRKSRGGVAVSQAYESDDSPPQQVAPAPKPKKVIRKRKKQQLRNRDDCTSDEDEYSDHAERKGKGDMPPAMVPRPPSSSAEAAARSKLVNPGQNLVTPHPSLDTTAAPPATTTEVSSRHQSFLTRKPTYINDSRLRSMMDTGELSSMDHHGDMFTQLELDDHDILHEAVDSRNLRADQESGRKRHTIRAISRLTPSKGRKSRKTMSPSVVPTPVLTATDTRVSLNRADNRASLNRADNRTSLNKGDTRESLNRADNRTSLNKGDTRESLNKVDNRTSLNKGDTRTSLNKGDTRESLNREDTRTSLNKGDTRESLNKVDNRTSLNKGDTRESLNREDTRKSKSREDTRKSKSRGDTRASQSRGDTRDTRESPNRENNNEINNTSTIDDKMPRKLVTPSSWLRKSLFERSKQRELINAPPNPIHDTQTAAAADIPSCPVTPTPDTLPLDTPLESSDCDYNKNLSKVRTTVVLIHSVTYVCMYV